MFVPRKRGRANQSQQSLETKDITPIKVEAEQPSKRVSKSKKSESNEPVAKERESLITDKGGEFQKLIVEI